MSFIFNLWACVAPGLTTIDEPVNAGKQPEIVEGPYWDECSFNGGDHICDLILPTADGGEERLYDYYGEVIVIDVSAMWCGPCQQAASQVNSVKVMTGGVRWITVLAENLDGEDPTMEDGQMWGDYFGLWHDEIWLGSRMYDIDVTGTYGFPLTGWPFFAILDKDLRIRVVKQGWNKDEMLLHIAELKSEP